MNFKEMFPLQYYINLDTRPDRRKICEDTEFPKMGINPIRFPGIVYKHTGNHWINGAVGCMLSHVSILKKALEEKKNVAIFEDDVKFLPMAKEIVDGACEELGDSFDLFYLGANILRPFYKVSPHLAKLNHCQSTVAYCVNCNFIEKLLSNIPLNVFNMPIDVIYSNMAPLNNFYITIPMVVVQRNNFSDIENQEVDYESYLEERYWDNIVC